MADWSTPNFAGLIGDLNDRIASPPVVDVSKLFDAFTQGREESRKANFQREAAKGIPKNPDGSPNYGAMAEMLFRNAGSPEGAVAAANFGLNVRGQEQANEAAQGFSRSLGGIFGGTPTTATPTAAPRPAAPTTGGTAFQNAIAGIESGGRYDALGPVTKTGDRAYGKYQIMGANIPQWSQEILGRRMTPQEFVANPEAQDAIFNGKFGQYAQKYGPEGAARAWFAGERGMNNPNARDQLGTSVQQYGQRFMGALGPNAGQPVQVASATPMAFAPPGSAADAPGVAAVSAPAVSGNPPPAPQAAPVVAQAQPVAPGGVNAQRMQQAIPALIAASANPRLPEASRAMAKTLLEHALKGQDLPEPQKNYAFYLQQGGTDDFTTWDRKNKSASSTLR